MSRGNKANSEDCRGLHLDDNTTDLVVFLTTTRSKDYDLTKSVRNFFSLKIVVDYQSPTTRGDGSEVVPLTTERGMSQKPPNLDVILRTHEKVECTLSSWSVSNGEGSSFIYCPSDRLVVFWSWCGEMMTLEQKWLIQGQTDMTSFRPLRTTFFRISRRFADISLAIIHDSHFTTCYHMLSIHRKPKTRKHLLFEQLLNTKVPKCPEIGDNNVVGNNVVDGRPSS